MLGWEIASFDVKRRSQKMSTIKCSFMHFTANKHRKKISPRPGKKNPHVFIPTNDKNQAPQRPKGNDYMQLNCKQDDKRKIICATAFTGIEFSGSTILP